MSQQTPREIADARLARGEISLEEHGQIVGNISALSERTEKKPESISSALPASSHSNTNGWEIVKGLAGVGLFVFFFFIYPVNEKSKDLASAEADCRRMGAMENCSCIFQKVDDRISFTAYIPIVKWFVKPSDAQGEQIILQAARECA